MNQCCCRLSPLGPWTPREAVGPGMLEGAQRGLLKIIQDWQKKLGACVLESISAWCHPPASEHMGVQSHLLRIVALTREHGGVGGAHAQSQKPAEGMRGQSGSPRREKWGRGRDGAGSWRWTVRAGRREAQGDLWAWWDDRWRWASKESRPEEV